MAFSQRCDSVNGSFYMFFLSGCVGAVLSGFGLYSFFNNQYGWVVIFLTALVVISGFFNISGYRGRDIVAKRILLFLGSYGSPHRATRAEIPRLIRKVICLECRASNPIEAEACQVCGKPIPGSKRRKLRFKTDRV